MRRASRIGTIGGLLAAALGVQACGPADSSEGASVVTTAPVPAPERPPMRGHRVALGQFHATPQEVVEDMLELAGVTADDVVYDLGSGDGRIVITAAAQFGARGVGVEIDPELVAVSRANAEKAGVADRVEFQLRDALGLGAELGDATVVTLYVPPQGNMRLRRTLERYLKPGTRVVSHDADMPRWVFRERRVVRDDHGGPHTLYLWRMGEHELPADRAARERSQQRAAARARRLSSEDPPQPGEGTPPQDAEAPR